ncbi:uncharacterized peptidase C1-like protein F26E4.3 isoform X2 [Anneissia japonica]|uniref:uncharacterized peptidase C1-like protein F26E4.3 isoform X2 n=1 Tax=Anneissia japonica TaxID=1529436 RepID=UPI00142570C5|nr:uncharacterized peptidase C1-like protein F26E4.3 isoform X2 [Anneissia japonica]
MVERTRMEGTVIKIFSGCLIAIICFSTTTAQYCEVKGCCFGRDDSCLTPLGDHYCYCDEFCDRTESGDCCPDFSRECLGITPTGVPPGPVIDFDCVRADGAKFLAGASYMDNCNRCTCKEVQSGSGHAFECEMNACLIREKVINEVNANQQYGWTASNYTMFWGQTLGSGIRYRLGTMKPDETVMAMNKIQMEEHVVPDTFDAREKWPGYLEQIMDQGNCGSSWAFSTAAVASDRLAIQSMGNMKVILSPQHLLSCNTRRQRGCDGGYTDRAWYFLRKKGIVTDECYPYKSGMDSGMTMKKGHCMLPPPDHSPCPNEYVHSDAYKSTPPYRIGQEENEIKHEIFKNGPVQATFLVESDFFMYKSGVYRHTNVNANESPQYRQSGWHSVRIIGWGIGENGVPYWLCANSWGTNWGENGYFRIVRGSNMCEIESFVVGAWGKVDAAMMHKENLV